MAFDYENEKKVFSKELKDGKYRGGFIGNSGTDYQEREGEDLAAFKSYLKSNDFKSLNKEASKNEQ